MAKDDCLFCKIVAGAIPCEKIYEDDEVVAFLDINPVAPGHTLVVPKAHTRDFMSTGAAAAGRIFKKVHAVAGKVMSGTGADGFALTVFNGASAGQEVLHLHVHIIPRKAGDALRLGWPHARYADGEMKRIAGRIRSAG